MLDQYLPGFDVPRELPVPTLSGGCAGLQVKNKNWSFRSRCAIKIADWLLCYSMKTAGPGIQRVPMPLHDRLVLRDIGLKFLPLVLEPKITFHGLRSVLRQFRGVWAFVAPPECLSASAGGSEWKSYMQKV